MKQKKIGPIQRKILLLLIGGLVLGATRNPKNYWKVISGIKKEWQKINQQTLERAINGLYKSKLISEKNNPDGTTTLFLTDNGKRRTLTFNLDKLHINTPSKWDGYWRIVISDVPEKEKILRDSLRLHMKKLGFYPLQKSVFVHPYDCRDEIKFITEWYDGNKYIRFIIAKEIDNEIELKKYFKLI